MVINVKEKAMGGIPKENMEQEIKDLMQEKPAEPETKVEAPIIGENHED